MGMNFKTFSKSICSRLMPFNGTNENGVVIMDNCSVHHVAHVTLMIAEVGAIVQQNQICDFLYLFSV